jgi:hypothetical protein
VSVFTLFLPPEGIKPVLALGIKQQNLMLISLYLSIKQRYWQ